MRFATVLAIGSAMMLAACSSGEEDSDTAEADGAAPTAVEETAEEDVAEDADGAVLRQWMIGSWSYEDNCANDNGVRYNRDGTLMNSGEIGTWSVAGATLTETITEQFEMGDEGTTKLNPPNVRKMDVEMVDNGHGLLIFEGEEYPILRC